MKLKLVRFGTAALAAMAIALAGCGGGSDGAQGPEGPGGPAGPTGSSATATVSAAALTPDQWMALTPKVDPASISVDISKGTPIVKFKVTDANGTPVIGLGGQKKAATALVPTNYNMAFTLAKLVPGTNGSPSKWVTYLVNSPGTVAAPATVANFPQSDSQGTLVDNGDGSYQYTFWHDISKSKAFVDALVDAPLKPKAALGDTTYDPTLTHRLGIIINGAQPGTGTNTPNAVQVVPQVLLVKNLNVGFDFVPAGGAVKFTRDIVVKDSCSECHDGKGIGHAGTNVNGWQVGRNDPRLCVTCHTDQIRFTFDQEASSTNGGMTLTGTTRQTQAVIDGRAVGNFPNLIHKMHMGDRLTKQGYNFNADAAGLFNEKLYPQDQGNCTKCHDGSANAKHKTADGDNWKNAPSALACGACHDGINFATGTGTAIGARGQAAGGHVGGAQSSDALCAVCHDAASIPVYHRITIPTPNQPIVKAGVHTFAYKISGVTINSSNQVVVKFQVLMDGTAVKFNTYAAGTQPITGFTGGPSFKVAYATGQDGIAAPSDWNSAHDAISLTDLWAQANGNTLSAPDATNTYTAVLAGSSIGSRSPTSHTMAVPADAKMVTAIVSDSFVQTGLTDLAGAVPGTPAMMAATGNTPDGKPNVARRVIFSEDKCNSCHERLGTNPYFHNGNYSIAMCAICHTPNQGGSTGWSASFRVWVHGIHSAGKRSVPFTWHAVSATENYSNLEYPGVLKDCQQCHLPGTYDFSASQYTPSLIAGMLNVQATTGKLNPGSATAYVFPQAAPVGSGNWAYGLKVDNTTDYGAGWSINNATGTLVAKTTQDNNLVTSPITAVCSTCHDTATATAHMEGNGGSFYDSRSAAVTRSEQCLVCHGSGKVADIKVMHQ